MNYGTEPGDIGWVDLTVEDATGIRDFYASVVGWTPEPQDMGGYDDFNMVPADGAPRVGVCHARGANTDIPPVWLVYFVVEDIDASIEACKANGGALLGPIREMGASRMCIIQDPAGATCALYEVG